MSLQDWLEYFEAVNGRKPSDLEIQQALAAGEFVDDETSFVTEPVETTTYDVMEEPIPTTADASEESVYDQQTTTPEQPLYTEQPIEQPLYTEQSVEQPLYTEQSTQAQQPYYTEQGAQVDPAGYTQGAGQQPYYTEQGAQANPAGYAQGAGQQYYTEQGGQPNPAGYAGQPVAPQGASNDSAAKAFFSDFWNWSVSAWKAPTSSYQGNQYNSFLSLGLMSFFMTIVLYKASTITTSLIYSYTGQSAGFDFSQFFRIFVAIMLYLFSNILAGFVAKRYVYADESFSFMKSFDYYGRLYSITTAITAFAALFGLIEVYGLSAFLLFTSMIILSMANTFAIAQSLNKTKMDTFYKYLIAILVVGAIIGVFSALEMQLIGEIVTSMFSF